MKLLLDTNRLSDALAGVARVVETLEIAEAVYVPVIALGELRSGFLKGRRPGTPIPTNDLWIAAIAIEHGLSLYTRDAHFRHVPGLACL